MLCGNWTVRPVSGAHKLRSCPAKQYGVKPRLSAALGFTASSQCPSSLTAQQIQATAAAMAPPPYPAGEEEVRAAIRRLLSRWSGETGAAGAKRRRIRAQGRFAAFPLTASTDARLPAVVGL